jgi:serine acetyltransferase
VNAGKVASFVELVKGDFRVNKTNAKGFAIMSMYRIGRAARFAPPYMKPFAIAYMAFYKLVTDIVLTVNIPLSCEIGPAARIFHGYGLVIHWKTKIGSNVVLRHGVTIGMNSTFGEHRAPIVGDYVEIGACAMILGAITIGDHAVIGANAVVVKDVPAHAVVVGNPARVVRVGKRLPALAAPGPVFR